MASSKTLGIENAERRHRYEKQRMDENIEWNLS